ncbi:MAG: hypothetical protein EP330_15745 [Deltaproteobacteria bacterium]|nr:MAG: hypothetical protein EP330_15745 [Deltaproteobacteria bacterium]
MSREFARIAALRARVGAGPRTQRNAPFESDCELLQLGEQLLALTVDTLGDELREGLVADLYSVGWLAAVASLSDLAAVGARPEGLLCSLSLPEEDSSRLDAGLADALAAHGVGLLGGDLQFDSQLSVTTVGVGTVAHPLTRRGTRPGDVLFAAGAFGAGNLLALTHLPEHEAAYRPRVDFDRWLAHVPRVRACTDSSDGLLGALHNLADGVGFEVDLERVPFVDAVREVCAVTGLPLAGFAAGVVGDYGLVFTAAPAHGAALETAGFARLGRAVEGPHRLVHGEALWVVDEASVASLAEARSAEALLAGLAACRR